MSSEYRVYGYRWVVLAAFMVVNLMIQVLWISYAPITSVASETYGVSSLAIGALAMSFMIAFVPLALPAAWVTDTRGFRPAVGFGVVLMAVFGVARGLVGTDYWLVLLCTVGLAVAQPFLMVTWTKLPANWFAPRERATAVGLITFASMSGIAVGMAVTPVLADAMPLARVQLVYGIVAAASAVVFLVLAREHPPTPPCPPGDQERVLVVAGLRHAFHVKSFSLMLVVAFLVMSAFNGVTTWVEQIVEPRGFSTTQAGTMGAIMLFSGIIGAVVLSTLSDRRGKRIRYAALALAATAPGMVGIAFASSTLMLYASAAALGFFLVASFPILMQYAAEVTYPTPEGTSNGLIQLSGQVSVVFVFVMEALRTSDGSFTVSLLLLAVLLAGCALAVSRLQEHVVGVPLRELAGPALPEPSGPVVGLSP